jgi:uncharacterized protein YfdQ (DUF2303 family)
MGVNHGSADVRMAQQLLHTTDIDARVEQVSGKRMSQRVRRNFLDDSRGKCGSADRTADSLFVAVVTAIQFRSRIE